MHRNSKYIKRKTCARKTRRRHRRAGGGSAIYPNLKNSNVPLNWINPSIAYGGGCNCGLPKMKGGSCNCDMTPVIGKMGGGSWGASSAVELVPNGLVGKAWTGSPSTWPGVNGIVGDGNHFKLNTYANDVSRQANYIGANWPHTIKGGRRGRSRRRGRSQRGGSFSNLLGQDFINLNRSFLYNVNNAYNALNGNTGPVNPLPWKGQLAATQSK